MKVSAAGLDLIKKHEGLRLTAYPDPATGGEPWTIGYGITSSAGVGKITKGMKITLEQAEDMLRRALGVYERGVQDTLTRRPSQHQFDAMVSLAYNIGVPAFRKSSVARFFNAGEIDKAAGAFLMWNKAAGKVMPGLTKRRASEREWFLRTSQPVAANPPPPATAPTPVQPPPPPAPAPIDPLPPAAGRHIAAWLIGGLGLLFAAFAAWMTKGS
jgi:lysozyme